MEQRLAEGKKTLSRMNGNLVKARAALDQARRQQQELQGSIDLLRKQLKQAGPAAQQPLTGTAPAPEPGSINVEVSSVPLAKPKRGNNFRFTFKLKADKQLLDRIKRVDYKFNYPGFRPHSSTNASNAFSVYYDGWGAIDSVDYTITWKGGGQPYRGNVNMVEALGL